MEAVQSGDEKVQHKSELDAVKAGLATASVDLMKTMHELNDEAWFVAWASLALCFQFTPLHGCHIQHMGVNSMRRMKQLPLCYLALLKCKLDSLAIGYVNQARLPSPEQLIRHRSFISKLEK